MRQARRFIRVVGLWLACGIVGFCAVGFAWADVGQDEAVLPPEIGRRIEAATLAARSGRYSEAIQHYSAVLEEDGLMPASLAYVYFSRGITHQKMGLSGHAVADYTNAALLESLPDTTLARVHYNRGIAYDDIGQLQRALQDFSSAVKYDPEFPEAFNNRANLYRRLGLFELALADYTKSIERGNPLPHLPHYGRGLTYETLGESNAAYKDFVTAQELAPEYEPAALKVGEYPVGSGSSVITANVGPDELFSDDDTSLEDEEAPEVKRVTGLVSAADLSPNPAAIVGNVSAKRPKSDLAAIQLAKSKQQAIEEDSEIDSDASVVAMGDADPSDGFEPHRLIPTERSTTPIAVTAKPAPASSRDWFEGESKNVDRPEAGTDGNSKEITAPIVTASVDPVPRAAKLQKQKGSSAAPSLSSLLRGTDATTEESGDLPLPYLVQVAAYQRFSKAEDAWAHLSQNHEELFDGLEPYISPVDLGARGFFYRLRLGPFDTHTASVDLCGELKSRGQDCVVISP